MPKRGRRTGRGGLGFKPKLSRGLPVGSVVVCACNSGAKQVRIVSVSGYKSRLNRFASASIGDLVKVAVQTGTPEMRRQLVNAVIVRQRKPYRRPAGNWVAFEDNAAVIVSDEGTPKGTEIRGPIAKEAAELWVDVAKLASIIL